MIARLYRPLLMGLLPLALVSCVSPAPTVAEEGAAVPLGVDLGGSGPVIASPPAPAPSLHAGDHPSSSTHGGVQIAHAGDNDAHGTGTVNSVDPAQHKLNISHHPRDRLAGDDHGVPGRTVGRSHGAHSIRRPDRIPLRPRAAPRP